MRYKMIALLLAVSLMLSGCGWMDGSRYSVTPHREQRQSEQTGVMVASNYLELMAALEEMISDGTESGVINVAEYPADAVESGIVAAVRHAMEVYPIGAYAVEEINYELGSGGGLPAVAVSIVYRHSRTEIQMIRQVTDMEDAAEVIMEALEDYDAGVVLQVENYRDVDIPQLVQDYAEENPQTVMETPQVAAAIHGSGKGRVMELTFTYQTSRESLRQMQAQVKPVFDAAVLYVSGDGADRQKYSQLYAFLMERFDYKVETSITPAYSLLRHGVGDSRAFATVYAAMCRDAGLECMVVTGTCSGEPRTWNIVLDGEHYYHVDLLRCSALGSYRESTDNEMTGYVWDYSAYPECPEVYSPPAAQETVPAGQESTSAAETTEQTEAAKPVKSSEEPEPTQPETVETEETEETTAPEEPTENLD